IPILTYMYDTSNASRYIIFMAPFFLLLYIQAPLQSALFGLDLAKEAMWNSIIGSIFKFITLFFLASNEKIGIMGVAISLSATVVLITVLHLSILYKHIRFTFRLTDLVKMAILLVATGTASLLMKRLFSSYADS